MVLSHLLHKYDFKVILVHVNTCISLVDFYYLSITNFLVDFLVMKTNKTMISIRVPQDVLVRLDAWRESQPAEPQRTAVIVAAVNEFLDHHPMPKEVQSKSKKDH